VEIHIEIIHSFVISALDEAGVSVTHRLFYSLEGASVPIEKEVG
jgi:hypothetical protein